MTEKGHTLGPRRAGPYPVSLRFEKAKGLTLMKERENHLESIESLDLEGRVNVEKTNELRAKAILDFLPAYHKGYWRIIKYNKEGLLAVEYSETMPEKIETVYDEFVTQFIAKTYLGVDAKKIQRLIEEKKLRRGKYCKVSLRDLNQIKFIE